MNVTKENTIEQEHVTSNPREKLSCKEFIYIRIKTNMNI